MSEAAVLAGSRWVLGGRSFVFAVENEVSSLGACAISLLMWGDTSTSQEGYEGFDTCSLMYPPFCVFVGTGTASEQIPLTEKPSLATPHFVARAAIFLAPDLPSCASIPALSLYSLSDLLCE